MKKYLVTLLFLLLTPALALALPATVNNTTTNPVPVQQGTAGADGAPWPVVPEIPNGTAVVQVTATGAAAAAVSGAMPATASKTNWICGFTVTSANPTASVSGVVTVTDGATVTKNYEYVENASTGGYLSHTFTTCIPSSAADQAITVALPAITSGAVSAVNVWGFQR